MAFRESLRFLVYVLYCLEGGLFLLIAPWRSFWDRNYFFRTFEVIGQVAGSNVTRGLVSAIGLVLLLHGLSEVVRAVFPRRPTSAEPPAETRT